MYSGIYIKFYELENIIHVSSEDFSQEILPDAFAKQKAIAIHVSYVNQFSILCS